MKNRLQKSILIATLSAFGGLSHVANAQAPLLEKTYEISNKAKKGFLDNIQINKEKETFEMVYVVPNIAATKRDNFLGRTVVSAVQNKIKYQVYTYDKNLELIGEGKEEERPSITKFKDYSYNTVSVTPTLFGIMFTKIQVDVTYDWFFGYRRKTKEIEKLKARQEDGGKYSFVGSYDVAAEKAVLALCGKKVKKTWSERMNYDILLCDADANVIVADSIRLKYPNGLLYSGQLKDTKDIINDELARDWILIFAPIKGYNNDDPNHTNFTYFRISPKGKIIENFSFDSPSNCWNIEGAYEQNSSVYLYGSAITKDPAKNYYSDVMGSKWWDNLTMTNYQIGKISNGKFDFLSSPSLKDITAKQAKPKSQSKFLELDGKEAQTTGITILISGDILINYQDYEMSSAPQGNPFKNFKSLHLFRFDGSGNLKKNYEVEINPDQGKIRQESEGAWATPPLSEYYPSADGKKLYWLIRSVKNVPCMGTADANQNSIICKPMSAIDYGSIDLVTEEISDFKTMGYDKKNPFYLYPYINSYLMNNYIYFFSETEIGDKMLLTRIDVSK